jgi:hypothetical protein
MHRKIHVTNNALTYKMYGGSGDGQKQGKKKKVRERQNEKHAMSYHLIANN